MQGAADRSLGVILDARPLPQDTVIDADVCVVGAGAAGITLAHKFVGQPFKVCLLESGGLEFDDETQLLYAGENVGLPLRDPDISRLRYFGGTTNHWAGECRPLDADDFAIRPWIPYSGWPIAKAELDPYYPPANEIVQIDAVNWNPEFWAEQMPEFYRLPLMGRRLLPAIWQRSPPTRFGQTYRDELARADNVETYLFANVINIETDDAGGAVTRLRVACLEGNRFWVKARIYVLATGGIENARILLLSNKARPAGVGNSSDTVGRFFMNHPKLDAAWLALSTPSDLMATPFSALTKTAVRLTLAPDVTERERIAKFSAHLHPTDLDGVYGLGKGYNALRRIITRIRNAELPRNFFSDVMDVIGDIDGLTSDLYGRYGDMPVILMATECEQVPNPDSRVTLGPDRDALGLNRIQLDWRFTDLDKYSLRRSLEIVGEEVGRAGLGRLKFNDWVLSDDLSSFPGIEYAHHMGTTRMTADPKTGVVDKNCRVHDVHNLFIAGSSVFPTGGIANPTLTIVALALRLADHIKELMGTTVRETDNPHRPSGPDARSEF